MITDVCRICGKGLVFDWGTDEWYHEDQVTIVHRWAGPTRAPSECEIEPKGQAD